MNDCFSRFWRLALAAFFLTAALASCDLIEDLEEEEEPETETPGGEINDQEKAAAVAYLNEVRADPDAFSEEIGVDLSYVEPKPALKWDRTIAEVAQAKADDMFDRDYFDHVDPDGNGINIKLYEAGYPLEEWHIEPRSNNFFESLGYQWASRPTQTTATDMIKLLILDEGWDPPGHRNHLLGIDDFSKDNTEIGIGIAKGKKDDGKYYYYIAVVIARTFH